MMSNYYVYIMEADGYYKVGMTSNLQKRLLQINHSCPYSVSFIQTYMTNTKEEALLIEKNIHKKLKNKGLSHKYDWFIKGSKETIIATADKEYFDYISNHAVIDLDGFYAKQHELKVQKYLPKIIEIINNNDSVKLACLTGVPTRVINEIKKNKCIPSKKYFYLLLNYLKENHAN